MVMEAEGGRKITDHSARANEKNKGIDITVNRFLDDGALHGWWRPL